MLWVPLPIASPLIMSVHHLFRILCVPVKKQSQARAVQSDLQWPCPLIKVINGKWQCWGRHSFKDIVHVFQYVFKWQQHILIKRICSIILQYFFFCCCCINLFPQSLLPAVNLLTPDFYWKTFVFYSKPFTVCSGSWQWKWRMVCEDDCLWLLRTKVVIVHAAVALANNVWQHHLLSPAKSWKIHQKVNSVEGKHSFYLSVFLMNIVI